MNPGNGIWTGAYTLSQGRCFQNTNIPIHHKGNYTYQGYQFKKISLLDINFNINNILWHGYKTPYHHLGYIAQTAPTTPSPRTPKNPLHTPVTVYPPFLLGPSPPPSLYPCNNMLLILYFECPINLLFWIGSHGRCSFICGLLVWILMVTKYSGLQTWTTESEQMVKKKSTNRIYF